MKIIRVTCKDKKDKKNLENILATMLGMGTKFFVEGDGTENKPYFINAGTRASDKETPEVAVCKNGKLQKCDKKLKKIAQFILDTGYENFQIQSYY